MGDNDTTLIQPVFDMVTQILNDKIAPEVTDYARKRLYNIVSLYKEKANKTELLSNFLSRVPVTVWAFSHGLEDAVIAPEVGLNVIDLANTIWFNTKIVSIVACDTGKKLAPALVEAGARAVFAYEGTLTIRVYADTYEPLQGFKECLTKPKLIYDGITAKEVHEKTIEEYNKWIDYWDEEDPITADVLRNDREFFKLYGTGESRISLSSYVLMGMTDILAIAWIVLWSIREVIHSIMRLIRR